MKSKLNRTETMLASNQATMENEIGSERRRAEERYRSNMADLQDLQREYRDYKANYSVRRKAYEDANAKYTRLSYSSRVTTEFKIVLKDETELRATLLQVSESYDLALLKLYGYATPFIDTSSRVEVSQGSNVYAIGNPLGLRDFVTSGIVTSIQEDVLGAYSFFSYVRAAYLYQL